MNWKLFSFIQYSCYLFDVYLMLNLSKPKHQLMVFCPMVIVHVCTERWSKEWCRCREETINAKVKMIHGFLKLTTSKLGTEHQEQRYNDKVKSKRERKYISWMMGHSSNNFPNLIPPSPNPPCWIKPLYLSNHIPCLPQLFMAWISNVPHWLLIYLCLMMCGKFFFCNHGFSIANHVFLYASPIYNVTSPLWLQFSSVAAKFDAIVNHIITLVDCCTYCHRG